MIKNGGLITEFIHGIFPDKNNFVRRNRVIAGLSDATIVVESDIKGGSLITADLANSYSRDVFAMPGRLTDRYSRGCNKLIKSNRAALIESVEDIEYIMGWDANKQNVQKKLFVELTPEEEKIMQLFHEKGELNIDEICRTSGYTMSRVSALLLNMEFSGWVKCLPGKVFIKA
jgi:DNA processing protein